MRLVVLNLRGSETDEGDGWSESFDLNALAGMKSA